MKAAFSLGLAVVLLCALALRVPSLSLEYHVDESHHLLIALDGHGFTQLRSAIAEDSQPILDYALRRWVWPSLLGSGELPWRLPSLLASLGTVLLAGLLARRRLRAISPWLALCGGLLASLWVATQPIEFQYAGYARHYALAALASLVWAAAYILRGEPLRPWRLTAAGVFVTQLHFFAVPLVGAGFAMEWIAALRARRRRDVLALTAGGLAIVALLIALDWPAIDSFLQLPTMVSMMQQTQPAHGTIGVTVAALQLAWRWLGVLQKPAALMLAWLVLASCARGDAAPAARRLMVQLLVVLLTFAAMRRSSGYFNDRYFMPFLGVGFAALVLGLESAASLLPRAREAVAAAALIGLLVGAVREHAPIGLRFPTKNFSARYRQIDALRHDGHPTFLIAEPFWMWRVVALYWSYDDPPPAPPLLDWVHDQVPAAEARRALREFLAAHPDARVMWIGPRDGRAADLEPVATRFDCSAVLPPSLDAAAIEALVVRERLLP